MGASKRIFEDVRIRNAVEQTTTLQHIYNDATSTSSLKKRANIKTKTR